MQCTMLRYGTEIWTWPDAHWSGFNISAINAAKTMLQTEAVLLVIGSLASLLQQCSATPEQCFAVRLFGRWLQVHMSCQLAERCLPQAVAFATAFSSDEACMCKNRLKICTRTDTDNSNCDTGYCTVDSTMQLIPRCKLSEH